MVYNSPKVEVKRSQISEKGVFAIDKIKKDELIFDFLGSKGRVYTVEERRNMPEEWYDYDIQIDNDHFFGATDFSELEDSDFINHSCSPNAGIKGSLQIVAMRDIEPGEEITFDYAMAQSVDFELPCNCGSSNCRKLLTKNDWKIKELQKRYNGYFSSYLQDKIDAAKNNH